MNAHTPGPWKVERMGFVSVRAGKMRICDLRGWGYLTGHGNGALGLEDDEAERILDANVHLIAAAPDLFAALTGLLSLYVELVNCGDCGRWDPEAVPQVIAARAALANAEGRS